MALVSVLWSLGLMAVLATSLMWSGVISQRLTLGAGELATIDALAEAGVNRAVLGMLDPRPERRPRTDGTPQQVEFEGYRFDLAIQDELGRIDLNVCQPELLVGLLQSAGLDREGAAKLADKILDWRDPSSARRLNGAKESDYRQAGYSYGPRNGPFQSIDELMLVMDMSPVLFRRIEPAVTVYSGRQFIDPQVAPREALLALPSMDTMKADALLVQRRGQPAGATPSGGSALRGRAFTIRTSVSDGQYRFAHEATVRLTDDPSHPYWTLAWRRQ